MLEPYRVIDLSDERGLFCSSILADLGAEVIHIEPPGGSPARRAALIGAVWEAWARNTKSVVLDLDDPSDLAAARQLIRTADFLVESTTPGTLARLGLDYQTVSLDNPALVYVSISPFGQTGPRALDPATDLTIQAAAGVLIEVGNADRPPLRIAGYHAWAHAGAEAAGAALIAHHARQRCGLGQLVDVSAQDAMSLANGFASISDLLHATPTRRSGGGIVVGPVEMPVIFTAADGYVSLTFWFGPMQGPYTRRMMDWICEEGACDGATRNKDWIKYLNLLLSGAEPLDEFYRVLNILKAFIAARSVDKLFAEAQQRKIMLVPAYSLDQVLGDWQLAAREFWWQAHDLPGRPRVNGPMAKFSATPLRYRHRAPRLGEHTVEVRGDAGHRRAPVRPIVGMEATERALDDVKVLDFTWIMAGPWSTRVLADFGATIVKIEGNRRVDPIRLMQPLKDDDASVDNSGGFNSNNAGKMSVALDPNTDLGRATILDLVKWADVVVDSFSPKAMNAWRLDYETLRGIRPDIIMVSSSLFGQTGPYALMPGVGTMGSAMSGITAMTGWPDREPTGPWGPYTDFTSPRIAVAVILAALDHRAQTGQGQRIDIAQSESSIGWIAPELVATSTCGTDPMRIGNSHPAMSPHGVYATAAEETWVAIAVRNDADWKALCAAMEAADLAADPSLTTLEGRVAEAARVDAAIGKWASTISNHAAELRLRQHGIPGAALLDSHSLLKDPQLMHRKHVVWAPHAAHGTFPVMSTHVIMSRTPAQVRRAGPIIGEHTEYVLRTILGYDDEKLSGLRAAAAIP
jgi:crotonobetainyl-CoA:carnitine CoA-transferase CaiB-like acyl-CoA transferase